MNLEIKREMQELRRRAYFGDGFWSAGTRELLPGHEPSIEVSADRVVHFSQS